MRIKEQFHCRLMLIIIESNSFSCYGHVLYGPLLRVGLSE